MQAGFKTNDKLSGRSPLASPYVVLEIGDQEVRITNPDKVFFPRRGYTKLDLVHYYVAVADAALTGIRKRPMVLKRFPNGAEAEALFKNGRLPNIQTRFRPPVWPSPAVDSRIWLYATKPRAWHG